MSVAEFYAAMADDGRVMLRPGLWIVRARYRHSCTYWLCQAEAFEIELVDPIMDVAFLERRKVVHGRQWHKDVHKSLRGMPISA